MRTTKRLLVVCLAALMLAFSSCGKQTNQPSEPGTSAGTPVVTTAPGESETILPVTTQAPDTTPVTTPAPVTTEPTPETTTAPEPVIQPYVNPLTGLPTTVDHSGDRPAAVMINNIRIACPQIGIARADVLYECLVEGGLTRLMGVFSDYASLEVLGSVRSARDYYIDLAQNHDALYIHAGGSPQAYEQLKERNIDYICGVNMYTPNTFYRDQTRLATMGYEHSLMTGGSELVSGIAYKKYRTTLKRDFTSPFVFDAENCSAASGSEAKHVIMTYSIAQVAQFIYSENTNTYYRFQFGDVAHIDGATGEQLNFTNLLIIFNPVSVIPGDSSNRLAIDTTGSGKGYYVCGGKSVPITWRKETRDTPITLMTASGDPLYLTPGKTFVSILPTTAESTLELNHKS